MSAIVTVSSSAATTTLMSPSSRWPSSSRATPSPPKRCRGVLVLAAPSTSIARVVPLTTTSRVTRSVPVLREKPTGPASVTPWMPSTSAMPPAWIAYSPCVDPRTITSEPSRNRARMPGSLPIVTVTSVAARSTSVVSAAGPGVRCTSRSPVMVATPAIVSVSPSAVSCRVPGAIVAPPSVTGSGVTLIASTNGLENVRPLTPRIDALPARRRAKPPLPRMRAARLAEEMERPASSPAPSPPRSPTKSVRPVPVTFVTPVARSRTRGTRTRRAAARAGP